MYIILHVTKSFLLSERRDVKLGYQKVWNKIRSVL